MLPVALSDVIAVGEVPTAAEIEILAKAGFRSLLNTQPDGEVERLMPSADARVLAEKAGLVYRHLPVASRRPDERTVDAFAEALVTLPRPIYACCYSGARTAAAWALAATATMDRDAITASCEAAGYDIAFLRARLDERRAIVLAPKPNGVLKTDGATAGANGHGVAAPAAVPQLTPNILMPRAASAGGFAVAG